MFCEQLNYTVQTNIPIDKRKNRQKKNIKLGSTSKNI